MQKIFLPVAALAILSALSAHAAEFSTSTPIGSLPITITKPGNYYFVANMYATTFVPVGNTDVAYAIRVDAQGPVTINMRGFTLTGPTQVQSSTVYQVPVGISVQSSDVAVLNGTIVGFYSAITTQGVSSPLRGIVLENLTFKGQSSSSVSLGSNNSLVKHCDFTQAVEANGEPALLGNGSGSEYVDDLISTYDPVLFAEVSGSPNVVLNIKPLFSALPAQAAKFATSAPITSVPITITKPGNYHFAANLSYTGQAITINAPGPVTIDMRGFSLSGNIPGAPGGGTGGPGIQILSSNVEILNGTIVGGVNGIRAGGDSVPPTDGSTYLTGIVLEKLTFKEQASSSLSFEGINNSVVKDCDFTQGEHGFGGYGDGLVSDDGSQTGNAYVNDLFNYQNPIQFEAAYNQTTLPTLILNLTPVRQHLGKSSLP